MVGRATRLWAWHLFLRHLERRGHGLLEVFPCFSAFDVFVFTFHLL